MTTAEHKRRVKAVAEGEEQGKLFGFEEEGVPYVTGTGNGMSQGAHTLPQELGARTCPTLWA